MVRKIEFPRIVMVGSDCLPDIGEISKEVSQGKNTLLVTGEKTYEVAGKQVEDILKDSGFEVSIYKAEVADEPTVTGAQDLIKKHKINLSFGIGGGTNIDVAKLSSARENLPFISVPTAASHDGMGSPIASIHANHKFKSYPANAPIAIIADTKVIATAPKRMMAAGCGDMVANYTAVEDWRLAHKAKGEYFGDYAAALSIMSAKVVLDNATIIKDYTEDSVKLVMEALISSGAAMCITGNSRPCSGAEHMFSHALDRLVEESGLHGEQCGIGAIMIAYLHKLEWEKFRDALKTIGAPTTAKELGVSDDDIVKALTTANTIRDRYTILEKEKLGEKSARELAQKTGVIE